MKRILITGFTVIILACSTSDIVSGQQEKPPAATTVSPASLDFGEQVAKSASKPQRVTVTNTGGKDLYINSVVLGGDNHQDFVVKGDTCTGATIAANKSCVVDVAFAPTVTESRRATLVINASAPDSPQTVVLTGTGINSVDVPPKK